MRDDPEQCSGMKVKTDSGMKSYSFEADRGTSVRLPHRPAVFPSVSLFDSAAALESVTIRKVTKPTQLPLVLVHGTVTGQRGR